MTRRLGVVLCGGGVRALAHIGVLRALEQAHLPPDVVVGVSMGAAVATTYAVRDDWAVALEAVDRTWLPGFAPGEEEGFLRLRATLSSARRLAGSVWAWGRLGYEDYARATLETLFEPATTFAETRLPAAVVATDLRSGRRVVFAEGPLVPAALASGAIPGLARPMLLDDMMLVDGGFADPAPVDVARDLGADVVVAVHTGQHLAGFEADNWMQALIRSMEVGQRAFAEERLRHADVVLRPDFGERVHLLNFEATSDVVRRGLVCGRAAVKELRALLDR